MGTAHYANGQWTEGGDWLETAWRDDEGIEHAGTGLGVEARLGGEGALELILYGRAPHYLPPSQGFSGPPFVIEISARTGSVHYVSAETYADALDLLGRWAPAVTAEILSELLHEISKSVVYGGPADTLAELLAALELSAPAAARQATDARKHAAEARAGAQRKRR